MTEIQYPVLRRYRAQWLAAGRRLPITVSRSRYDDITVSWEVCWAESEFSETPIAEFTSWEEAQQWAIQQAHLSRALSPTRGEFGAVFTPCGDAYASILQWRLEHLPGCATCLGNFSPFDTQGAEQ